MLLPRDMESLDDCLCRGNGASAVRNDEATQRLGGFRCPAGSAAKVVHPLSFNDCSCLSGFARDELHRVCSPQNFRCIGRYQLKAGVAVARSIADCDCQHPYTKDEATGQCSLRQCPRAGNYVEKMQGQAVLSLADCACVQPFTKNDQSGECAMAAPYQCPPHSIAGANAQPRSFDDCYCDWGFVKNAATTACVLESAAYICPINSMKRADLPIGAHPRGFFDCECVQQGVAYARNEMVQSCDGIDAKSGAIRSANAPFECPPFSKPLAAMPHSVEQCECLPGYGWKTPEMLCMRMSTYECPVHAYKAESAKHVEESFADCACASGYYRDDVLQRCVEWVLTNDNGCPPFAYLKHWPLQSKANCECIYGLAEVDPSEPAKAAPRCNTSPSMTMDGKFTFSECPVNSLATSWPVSNLLQCSCLYGFDVAPMSDADLARGDGELFQCAPVEAVDVEEQALGCRAPMVLSKLTGACRLPLEEVVPRQPLDGEAPREGTVQFKGIEYDYVLTDENIMVTQGDIAIGELLTWNTSALDDPERGPQPATSHVLHGYYNAERDHRWRDATMCFQVDQTAHRFASMVRDAMAHISAATGFTFRDCAGGACRNDAQCSHDYVNVQATPSSCYSYIGRIGGPQPLGVSAQCGRGNVLHVLLHAIGLHHTIDRPDRDEHVRIAWECVPEAKRTNFVIEDIQRSARAAINNGDDDNDDVPYDFFSIMHHPADAFVHSTVQTLSSNNGAASPAWCQSVFPLITDFDERLDVLGSMGQRELLAVTDIHAVWKLYPALQTQDRAATYASDATTTDSDPNVFASRLHTSEDVLEVAGAMERSRMQRRSGRFAQRAASFIGAIVTLCGFGAFLAFAVAEVRKRTLRNADAFYAESLLEDRTRYD